MKNTSKALVALLSSALALSTVPALAQQLPVVAAPLVLMNRERLVVGGESIAQTPKQLFNIIALPPAAPGHVTINQMYDEFMEQLDASAPPVIMAHDAALSGKTFVTIPDGRMGWYEYFVHQAFPTYTVDQLSRARSGVDISVYNNVGTGAQSAFDLPNASRISAEDGLAQFSVGLRNGAPFVETQLPVVSLAAQSVPDFNATSLQPNPTYAALAELGMKRGGAMVMGHSEGLLYPLHAALADPKGVDKMILIEPGICHEMAVDADQMAVITSKPILVVFGDHLDAAATVPGFSWQSGYDDCLSFVSEINEAGDNATMPPGPA